MRMLPLSALMLTLLASPLAVGEDAPAPAAQAPVAGAKAVALRAIDLHGYASFPKNWDDAKHPLRAALIGDSQQWEAVFGAAFGGIGGQPRKPAAPDASVYEKEQFLMVSRVVNGDDLGKGFTFNSAQAHGDTLVVRYTFKPGLGKATYMAKDCALVALPRHAYAKVVLVENGRVAATLDKDHAQLPGENGAAAPKPAAAACPVCAKPGIPMVYGDPSPELMAHVQRGEAVLGGCNISPAGNDPHHACKGCDVKW